MADEQGTNGPVSAERPTGIGDLRPGMKLSGRVTRIDLYGAFVDVGIGKDALVHISKIRRGPINRVSEVLSVGDDVTVYVDRVDTASDRVTLAMIKPVGVSWGDLDIGQRYQGRVVRLERYGVFVDIGAERPGLVHISEMGDELLRHPDELLSVNAQVPVRVIGFDRRKRRIDLSLVAAGSDEEDGVEEEEEAPATSMEVALRKAFNEADTHLPARRVRRDRRSGARRRRTQDEILSRTLRSRQS